MFMLSSQEQMNIDLASWVSNIFLKSKYIFSESSHQNTAEKVSFPLSIFDDGLNDTIDLF